MNQQNQNNTPDGSGPSGDLPFKRKRGRPRKYPRPDEEESRYIPVGPNKGRNPVVTENAPVPPGFEGANGNQHLQRSIENNLNDPMVGQVVYGVIEAVFDAGYLLSVRVDNSDTTLRGLVFKPGRYVPVSPENDVAPGVPMIHRNEVPFRSGTTYTQVQNPLPRERNDHCVNIHKSDVHAMNGSPSVPQVPRGQVSSSNLISPLGKTLPSVADQTTPQLARGNVVPVLLQPNNFSNGVSVSNQPSQVMIQASLGSGASTAKEVPVDGNQALSSQTQTSQNMLSRGMHSEDAPQHQSAANVTTKSETNSVRLPGLPFEKLVTEVVKRVQAPADSVDTETDNSKSGYKTSLEDSTSRQEDKVNDIEQPILIKPLQTLQSDSQAHSASAFKPSHNSESGKMTELLQVLQDNKMENQASKVEELGSGQKVDDIRTSGTT